MLPAVIRGKKRVQGDTVSVTTIKGNKPVREFGTLEDYNPEDDEILIRFDPSRDSDWYSLDPKLDDVIFFTQNG
jgi:hypothetical protein